MPEMKSLNCLQMDKKINIYFILITQLYKNFNLTGHGKCSPPGKDQQLDLLYGTNFCSNWTKIETIPTPSTSQPIIHLVHLPIKAKQEGICIKWEEFPDPGRDYMEGCWALDNILITNMATSVKFLEEDFDGINAMNWLFFPGATIEVSLM